MSIEQRTKDVCSECGYTSFDNSEEALAWLREPTIEQMIGRMGGGYGVHISLGATGWIANTVNRSSEPCSTVEDAVLALHGKWKATEEKTK